MTVQHCKRCYDTLVNYRHMQELENLVQVLNDALDDYGHVFSELEKRDTLLVGQALKEIRENERH